MDVLKKINALAKLTRVEHSFMLAVAVLIALFLSPIFISLFTHQNNVSGGNYALHFPWSLCTHASFPPVCLIAYGAFSVYSLAMLVLIILWLIPPFFISLGAFALNDYLDLESDRINKRKDRPLVTNEISPKTALVAAILCFAFGLFVSFFISSAYHLITFGICVVFALLAIAYDYKLKDLPLLGNAYIATTMAIPFIYASSLVDFGISYAVLSFAAMAFLAGLGREIVKSIEDMEGDKKARGSKTLPILIGAQNASLFASAIFFVFVPVALSPLILGIPFKPIPTAIIVLADLAFLYMALKLFLSAKLEKSDYKFFRKLSLIALGVGLFGYLLAVLL